MSKMRAAIVLSLLVVTLVAVNAAILPNLSFFFGVGDTDGMFDMGKTVGSSIGAIFGGDILEFAVIVLFLA